MSHSTVLVCLPSGTDSSEINKALDTALAPFDENQAVEPYRSYEDGGPEDYWWVKSVRRGGEYRRHGAALAKADMRAEWEGDAVWAERLGEHPTWEDVAQLYNECWGHTGAVALPDDDTDSEALRYDPETGRAYTMTRYNPKSRWDWWIVGGRWRWSLLAKQGVDRSALIITELRGGDVIRTDQMEIHERARAGMPLSADYGPNGGLWCDGAPRGCLDFDAMREKARVDANTEMDSWEAFWRTQPDAVRTTARPWSWYRDNITDISAARAAYHSQPWVGVAESALSNRGVLAPCPLDKYGVGREEFVAGKARAAVPGYALLTLDGEWVERGRMGWFGMSSATDETTADYLTSANAYLDELDPDAWVVTVDVHI